VGKRSVPATLVRIGERDRMCVHETETVPISLDEVTRADLAEAADHASIARSLANSVGDGASAWPWGGGQLVITGAGGYVNRAMAAGLMAPVTATDFEFLEERSREAGVPAEVEVSPWADSSLVTLAADRGYRPTWFRTVLIHRLEKTSLPRLSTDLEVHVVGDDQDFDEWHEVTVAGFELAGEQQRAFARRWGEALRSQGDGRLLVASLGGVPVGVSSVAARESVALLGGMTTKPEARNRGVQQALIAFRLQRALDLGCSIALTTTAPGTSSERNLQRCGFRIAGTKIGVIRARG
jgi:GNAT superfamily N-acetyltransferase